MESTNADIDWEHSKYLILTGSSLGILHVLAGPDHLSALAVLAVGNSWRAMTLGIRWGVGHSTGMISVAIIFIIMRGNLDLKSLSRYCNVFVGVFMIILGCFGLFSALKIYNEKAKKSDEDLSTVKQKPLQIYDNSRDDTINIFAQVENHEIDESLDFLSRFVPFIDFRDPVNQRIISFVIGMLHGVAGPGGVLGVLPAVEMQNWKSSSLYLTSFVVASTFSMGCFAALYGEFTKRLGSTQYLVEFTLRALSSLLSVLIGVIWVTLSILGKMEEFFH